MDEHKKQVLEKLKHTYCRLMPSKIQGVGVFAIRDIPQGINPFMGVPECESYVFTMEELAGLDPAVLQLIRDFFVADAKGRYDIPEFGLNGIDIAFFVNSSSNPNLVTYDESVTFITNRPIKKGEELTVDYRTYDKTP